MTPHSPHPIRRPLASLYTAPLDPTLRRLTYGRIRPMDCDLTWWERLFRR